jgi:hypothetical protein
MLIPPVRIKLFSILVLQVLGLGQAVGMDHQRITER